VNWIQGSNIPSTDPWSLSLNEGLWYFPRTRRLPLLQHHSQNNPNYWQRLYGYLWRSHEPLTLHVLIPPSPLQKSNQRSTEVIKLFINSLPNIIYKPSSGCIYKVCKEDWLLHIFHAILIYTLVLFRTTAHS